MSYSYSAPLRVVTRLLARSIGRHRIAGIQLDAVLVEELARGEREIFDARAGEILGEVDAVVSQPRLFRQHGDRKFALPSLVSVSRKRWPTMPCPTTTIRFDIADLALVRLSNEVDKATPMPSRVTRKIRQPGPRLVACASARCRGSGAAHQVTGVELRDQALRSDLAPGALEQIRQRGTLHDTQPHEDQRVVAIVLGEMERLGIGLR